MPAIATIRPADKGPIASSAYTTSPWELWGVVIPGFGTPPTYAQFDVEVLQPPNVDGNRYRVAGAHFPEFTVNAIIPATSMASAALIAREIERTKGWQIVFSYANTGTENNFYVKEARGLANASRILGATASIGNSGGSPGPAPSAEALASVDISLVLQYFAP